MRRLKAEFGSYLSRETCLRERVGLHQTRDSPKDTSDRGKNTFSSSVPPLRLLAVLQKFSDKIGRSLPLPSIISIYNTHKRRVSNSAIAGLSSGYLSVRYIAHVFGFLWIATCLILVVYMGNEIQTGVVGLGLIPPSSLSGKRFLIFARVSSKAQLDSKSIEGQLSDLRDECDSRDGVVAEEMERAESGASMDRDSLNKVLELAENSSFDVLAVWKLDRLTRSNPWESFEYLRKLKETGVTLYASNYGYFDWEDRHDFEVIVREVLFAREWYSRIMENAENGQLEYLRQGKYPFGQPHFGYEKDEDDQLHLTEFGSHIIPKIFEKYLELGNKAELRRQINEKYQILDDQQLTTSKIDTVLRSPLCMGHLTLKNQVIETSEELQCVSRETYDKVQNKLSSEGSNRPQGEVAPPAVDRATARFGPEFLGSLFEMLEISCPSCDGSVEESGTTTVRNRILQKYACTECDFSGPIFDEQQINKLDSTLPLCCPFCSSVDEFTDEKLSSSRLEYLYVCKRCHNEFAVDVPPNVYLRAFERPDVAFRWDPNNGSSSTENGDSSEGDDVFIWVDIDDVDE